MKPDVFQILKNTFGSNLPAIELNKGLRDRQGDVLDIIRTYGPVKAGRISELTGLREKAIGRIVAAIKAEGIHAIGSDDNGYRICVTTEEITRAQYELLTRIKGEIRGLVGLERAKERRVSRQEILGI